MKKDRNYCSPASYNMRRNASGARAVENPDVRITETDKENKKHRKTDMPSPPVNARKEPGAVDVRQVHRSVYDEIAERRSKERQASSASAKTSASEEAAYGNEAIFSRSAGYEADSDYDVAQEYEQKPKSRTGLWTAFIIILSVLCIGAGGLYAYQMGAFDGFLS